MELPEAPTVVYVPNECYSCRRMRENLKKLQEDLAKAEKKTRALERQTDWRA